MFVQLHKEFMGRKVGERIDVSETDANALIAQQIASRVADDLITPAVQRAMEQAFAGFQKGQGAVINASLKSFQDAQGKSRRKVYASNFLDITTAQAAGNSPFFGGVIASWTAEAQTRSETEPAFKRMELKANEPSGYSVRSNVRLQDAALLRRTLRGGI